MGTYLPPYHPANAVSLTCSAAVTGGQLLAVSGNGTVAPAAAAADDAIGVAAFDAGTNERVTVYPFGVVHETAADGAITAGDQVTAGATGKVKSLAVAAGATTADINNARAVVGVALTTAADTAKCRWINR
jgi:hypothetical protein